MKAREWAESIYWSICPAKRKKPQSADTDRAARIEPKDLLRRTDLDDPPAIEPKRAVTKQRNQSGDAKQTEDFAGAAEFADSVQALFLECLVSHEHLIDDEDLRIDVDGHEKASRIIIPLEYVRTGSLMKSSLSENSTIRIELLFSPSAAHAKIIRSLPADSEATRDAQRHVPAADFEVLFDEIG